MPRPHILLTNSGYPKPSDVLDPRYHPLGQPGPRHRGPVFITKVPVGLRGPALVLTYCFVCWNGRHWLFPYGPKTVNNVKIPLFRPAYVQGMWERRFRTQTDVFRWGHIYAKMQENRIREAKKNGILPSDYPENEEQMNRLENYKDPTVKKVVFEVGEKYVRNDDDIVYV